MRRFRAEARSERSILCREDSYKRGTVPYDPQRHGPHRIVGPGFHEKVFEQVLEIPPGRVATYGDIARRLGSVRVARQVGFALAALPPDREEVPWHRVVNAQGRLHTDADDERGGTQRDRLLAEGVEVDAKGKIQRFPEYRLEVWPSDEE